MLKITPKPLQGQLEVIASKSLSHRYLIAAGLAKGRSQIKNVLHADDIDATKEALMAFGVEFIKDDIIGGKLEIVKPVVNVKESGSTLRFMIPIYLLDNHEITIHGEGRLPQRPLNVYQTLFANKKVLFKSLETDGLPLKLKGKLKGGHFPIEGHISSQFISGLLFALPLRREDSVIELLTPLESKGYVDLTLAVLKQFGIHILNVDNYYYIKGSQTYQNTKAIVEGDYSQAAFWMVAGLLGKEPLTLTNLKEDSLQGDSAIIDIIKSMGGKIETSDHGYIVYPSITHGITIDLKDIPDLGPILMVLAARSLGKTTFIHAGRLRMKESDRLQAMVDTLMKLGVVVEVDGDKVTITGQETFKGDQTLDAYGDHRIVMAIAIASILCEAPIYIQGHEAITKSYPTFFEDFKKLGGDICDVR